MNSGTDPKQEPRPDLTLPAALAPGQTGRQPPAQQPGRPREAWSEETRELYRSSLLPGDTPTNLYDVRTFHRLLVEAVKRAQHEQLPLAVVAFHAPTPGDGRPRRAVDLTLRLGVRGEDFPTRLTATTVAVAVAGPRAAATVLIERLVPLLTAAAEGPVVAGVAVHPDDGQSAYELLRVSAWRSLGVSQPRRREAELERLLGAPPASAGW
jgi:hypothetical protein